MAMREAGGKAVTPEGVQLGLARHGCGCSPVAVDMSDESVITIEIRGHERAALEAAHRISALFLPAGRAGSGGLPARRSWRSAYTRMYDGVPMLEVTRRPGTRRRRRGQGLST